MLKTLRFVSLLILSAHVSTLFAYVTRAFPEKILFLLAIRVAITLALIFIWKFAESDATKQTFAFISIGAFTGLLAGYWDELPTLSSAYPFEFYGLFFVVLIVLTSLVSSYVITTKSKSTES